MIEINGIKLIMSLVVVLIALLINFTIKRRVSKKIKEHLPKIARDIPFDHLLNMSLWILFIIALISIWGVDTNNLWIYLTSIVTLVAIGFFAVCLYFVTYLSCDFCNVRKIFLCVKPDFGPQKTIQQQVSL